MSKKKYPWNKSRDDDDVMNEVYAGPEFFEKQETSMEGVYAGPPMPEMMCVYAGPEFFSGKSNKVGVPAPVQPAEKLMFCGACSRIISDTNSFCPFCGAKQPKEEP